MATIVVEFYGIARERAGTAQATIEAATVQEAVQVLAEKFPRFAAECTENGQLSRHYIANINGERFVSDPATHLGAHDSLLIMSIDAGG